MTDGMPDPDASREGDADEFWVPLTAAELPGRDTFHQALAESRARAAEREDAAADGQCISGQASQPGGGTPSQ